ncbi:hypothetical protein DAPPUDRAFT_249947 [Daphnia pulex]|uniref:Uncharacterized protein n=1 Tax=Daphnia pulex TaxID=6669 RepID=E9GXL6_DAPPU|nr:hypothetical protein DAPPUDRAFT_249947 [Daphnia pulex]|eukprot:EFX75679.1 hypothetical protein DAPPUDRAFT_249947 [Daphnia pulex]
MIFCRRQRMVLAMLPRDFEHSSNRSLESISNNQQQQQINALALRGFAVLPRDKEEMLVASTTV